MRGGATSDIGGRVAVDQQKQVPDQSLAEMERAAARRGFGDLTTAEKRVLTAWRKGVAAQIGDTRLPQEPSETNRVRADFIAWLALQSNDPDAHPTNRFHVIGAWIDGPMDLAGQRIRANLVMQRCRFALNVVLSDAETASIDLTGSRIGMDGHRNTSIDARHLRAAGDLRLRDLVSDGGVALAGAEIRGDLDLSGSRFGKRRTSFHGYDFEVSVGAPNAKVQGALTMLRAPQEGAMFSGVFNLHNAEVDVLQDAPDCWPARGCLFLNGFRYRQLGSIKAGAAQAGQRGRWVLLQPEQDLKVDFKPQPFEQLARVLRATGHSLEARRIGVLHERMLRRAGKVPIHLRPFHWLFGIVAGYGYFTTRVLFWSAMAVVLGTLLFAQAWRDGAMAPTHADILLSEEWRGCLGEPPVKPAFCFLATEPGRDYEPFDAFFYSLDVFLPVVSLEQETNWSPSPKRGSPLAGRPSGYWAWLYRFIHELLGYVLVGFAVVGFAKLAERD